MSLPKYSNYKDSRVEWVDKVPAHWGVCQLKWLLDIQNGADYKSVEASDGYPVIGSGGPFAFATDYLFDGESVLLGRKGTIDKPLHVTGKFWTVDTMYWTRIMPDACGRFCYYTATTIPFDLYSTNTALPSMTKGALSAHLIARPPVEEQAEIAAFLDRETAKIDTLICEQEKLLALLAEKRQAIISHAVTRGLNPNVPMKKSGIVWLGEVPRHWEIVPFRYCVDFQEGPGIMAVDFYDEGVPLLRVSGVQSNWATLEGCNYLDPKRVEERWHHFRVEEGDLLISASASMGTVCEVGSEVVGSIPYTGIIRLKGIPGVMAKSYIRHLVVSGQFLTQIDLLKAGATIQHFGPTHLSQMIVVKPPVEEQAEIAMYLDNLLSKHSELENQVCSAINLLNERRSVLIAAAVTGKIDVRGVVEMAA